MSARDDYRYKSADQDEDGDSIVRVVQGTFYEMRAEIDRLRARVSRLEAENADLCSENITLLEGCCAERDAFRAALVKWKRARDDRNLSLPPYFLYADESAALAALVPDDGSWDE